MGDDQHQIYRITSTPQTCASAGRNRKEEDPKTIMVYLTYIKCLLESIRKVSSPKRHQDDIQKQLDLIEKSLLSPA